MWKSPGPGDSMAPERMRILHLFSDWKWTGPAEPVVDLVKALAARGLDVRFACSPLPFEVEDSIVRRAGERGITPITAFRLAKHFDFFANRRDTEALARHIDAEAIDIVHAHRLQDHWIAAAAIRKSARQPFLVRTCHDGVPQKRSFRNRRLYKDRTDLLIQHSREGYQADGSTFIMNRRLVYLPPAVDTERFDPEKVSGDLREELKIGKDEIVAGVVARIQEHRRFDLLLEGFRRIVYKYQNLKLVLVGRGTKMEQVAVRPVKKMKIEDKVVFAGYRRDDYLQAMKTFDILVFMAPGSDGTCRALLQALAMGIPAVTPTIGILPELVQDGVNGFLASPGSAGDISEGLARLVRDPVLRKRFAANARRIVLERYSLADQAKRVEAEYRKLMGSSRAARLAAAPPAPEALPAG